MTNRCVKCGLIVDCDWVENPTNDWSCDLANTPHELLPLHWARNVPGSRAAAQAD